MSGLQGSCRDNALNLVAFLSGYPAPYEDIETITFCQSAMANFEELTLPVIGKSPFQAYCLTI